MDKPLVTVICLCYNHERFVKEAVESVIQQTYDNIQIVIVDDASSDNSVKEIQRIIAQYPFITFLPLAENMGNCRAFNRGLALAKGDFIIDFATDDVMMPERIARQVQRFARLDDTFGVVFTDAVLIDENGKFLRHHYEYLFMKGLLKRIPQGNVYADVLHTYFISAPTMMVRKAVFDSLSGYDEALSYEDFDFWIRSARNYKYAFLDERLTKVRRSENSMSRRLYVPGDAQLHSTYLVCKKAQQLNRSPEEHNALVKRVEYELRQSVFSENHKEAGLFYELLVQLKQPSAWDRLWYVFAVLRLPLSMFRKLYHRIRYA